MHIVDQIRGFSLLSAMLGNRAYDPFCGTCNSFNVTLAEAKDRVMKFAMQYEAEVMTLPEDFSTMFTESKNLITAIEAPENPVGQKKLGKCRLPDGVCFTKMSLAAINNV